MNTQMFYTSILYVAFFTILFSILIGVILVRNKSKTKKQFPPTLGKCPDYWRLTAEDKNKYTCEATKEALEHNFPSNINLKECSIDNNKVCFNTNVGKDSSCVLLKKRKNWVSKCNITWDGISNNNVKPDSLDNIGRSFFSLF
tara:strand:+ start:261 stop:689 length:429 start_codon:yes stop_codon:yes gene_type:complete